LAVNLTTKLALGVALATALAGCGPNPEPGGACAGEQAQSISGESHVPEGTSVSYPDNPPSSGDHWACWAPWGVASTVLPPERWVHNLEHGGVVLLFKCETAEGCPALSEPLVQIAANAPDAPGGGHRILVTGDPSLPSNVAAVAWGFSLLEDAPDAAALDCFIGAHEGMGPEDIPDDPPRASCPQSYP